MYRDMTNKYSHLETITEKKTFSRIVLNGESITIDVEYIW